MSQALPLIETVGQVAHAAVRELGIVAGEVDVPTWQILPGDRKTQYCRAAEAALEENAAIAGDAFIERLAFMAYERWAKESPVVQPTWAEQSGTTRLHWRMIAAVARVVVTGTAVARGVAREQA